jgi:hypothetical protein
VGNAAGHPLLSAHAARRRPASGVRRCASPTPSSPAARITTSFTPICSTHPASSTASRSSFAPSVVRWSSRGSVALSVSSPSATATCSISPRPRGRAARCRGARAARPRARQPTHRRAPPSCCSTVTGRSSFRAPTPSAGWPSTSGRPSTGLAARAGRRVARAAAAPAADQRARRPAPLDLPLTRRSAHPAARGEGRELPHRRARPPRPDRAGDRGAARGHRDGERPTSLGSCSSAFTPSASGSRGCKPSSACGRPPTPSSVRRARALRHRAYRRTLPGGWPQPSERHWRTRPTGRSHSPKLGCARARLAAASAAL